MLVQVNMLVVLLKELGYEQELTENAIRLSFSGHESIKDGEEFMLQLKKLLTDFKERQKLIQTL